MTYTDVTPGVFLARPNRFIARVRVNGAEESCHVKNTGRLAELLLPGAPVWLQRTANPDRKTRYDLVTVEKDGRLFNIDSAAPNRIFAEWLPGSGWLGVAPALRAEVPYGRSRLDFAVTAGGQTTYVEVKGVTLKAGGTALFPDAPTPRGVRHLEELAACRRAGFDAAAVFVVQFAGAEGFAPNMATHPAFGAALAAAAAQGARVAALACRVTPDSVTATGFIPVRLPDVGTEYTPQT